MTKKIYIWDRNRLNAPFCPCGKDNRNGGFFSPIEGYTDKGKCFKCGSIFHPDANDFESPEQKKSDRSILPPLSEVMPPSYIPPALFKQSLGAYEENTLINFIAKLTSNETAAELIGIYNLGTSHYWHGSTVFWQIDANKKIRSGKVVQYKTCEDEKSSIGINCKRVKIHKPPFKWVHKLAEMKDFTLVQCFFGEHLLSKYPEKTVCILESEKSALIATAYIPEYIWLASGGSGGLNKNWKVLEGRNITLFPDLKFYDDWRKQAIKLGKRLEIGTITVSDILEKRATNEEREAGLDLADYLIMTKWSKR